MNYVAFIPDESKLVVTVTCMWSGGILKRNPVRPAGKWAQGLTCQTAKTPACHIQIVTCCAFSFKLLTIIKILQSGGVYH